MHSSLPILRIHYLVLNFPMIGGCYDLVGYIDPRSPYSVILPVVLLHKNNKRHKNELNDKYISIIAELLETKEDKIKNTKKPRLVIKQ